MITKDFIGKFSFQDILAYFLPGTAISLGICFFLIQIEKIEISRIKLDIFIVVLFFIISFIVGIAFSGLSEPIVSVFYWLTKKKKPETDFLLKEKYQDKINQLLSSNLDVEIKEEWDEENFVFCNIFVKELLPTSFSYSYRQKSLRLMRKYMLFPIVLWTINGIIYGIKFLSISPPIGLILIVISILLGFILLRNVWNRMHKNSQRDVRNILASFICIDKIYEIKHSKKDHTSNK